MCAVVFLHIRWVGICETFMCSHLIVDVFQGKAQKRKWKEDRLIKKMEKEKQRKLQATEEQKCESQKANEHKGYAIYDCIMMIKEYCVSVADL